MTNEPHGSDARLAVLHGLRSCGFTSLERVTAVVEADVDVESVLLGLAGAGLVQHNAGDFGGWGLTDAGREADKERIAAELEGGAGTPACPSGVRRVPAAEPAHPRHLRGLAGRAWEQPMVLNDHTDRAYDEGVLARLAAVDAEVQPICRNLAARLSRFGQYGPRLAFALDRAQQGDVGFVADGLDSYHSVWFQLHEDLLVTLGINRWSA